jgi:hypothetical protein
MGQRAVSAIGYPHPNSSGYCVTNISAKPFDTLQPSRLVRFGQAV